MPKKQKTRKQKLQAEQRKKVSETKPSVKKIAKPKTQEAVPKSDVNTTHASYTLPTSVAHVHPVDSVSPAIPSPVVIATKGYEYLKTDLRKTTLITSAIVLVQVVIYFTIL